MSEVKEKIGIEESMDIIKYADALLDELAKHKADDGKIDTQEVFQTLSATAPEAVNAVVGSWSVPKELADLDAAESSKLLEASFPLVLKLVGMFTGVKPAA